MDNDLFIKARTPFKPEERDWICIVNRVKSGQNEGKAMFGAYIPIEMVRDRLSAIFGAGGWSFEIVGRQVDRSGDCDMATVFGRLKIGDAFRDDCGQDEIDKGGDTRFWKSAVSRALVRCAASFGIGDECRDIPFAFTDGPYKKPNYPPMLPKERQGESQQKHADPKPAPAKTDTKPATSKPAAASTAAPVLNAAETKALLHGPMEKLRTKMGKDEAEKWLTDTAKVRHYDTKSLSQNQGNHLVELINKMLA